jgi:hypothetical protein
MAGKNLDSGERDNSIVGYDSSMATFIRHLLVEIAKA